VVFPGTVAHPVAEKSDADQAFDTVAEQSGARKAFDVVAEQSGEDAPSSAVPVVVARSVIVMAIAGVATAVATAGISGLRGQPATSTSAAMMHATGIVVLTVTDGLIVETCAPGRTPLICKLELGGSVQ